MGHFKKINYSELDARQKENFNFQWISGALATYGYHTHRIPDDWLGADFIARHMSPKAPQLLVQLKGRVYFSRKYFGKNIWIAFRHGDVGYCYPHDEILKKFKRRNPVRIEKAWKRERPEVHWKRPTKVHMELLEPYRIDIAL